MKVFEMAGTCGDNGGKTASGQPCKRTPAAGEDHCKIHACRDFEYFRRQVAADPLFAALSDELRTVEALLRERLDRSGKSPSNALWGKLIKLSKDYEAATVARDRVRMATIATSQQTLIRQGATDTILLGEISKLADLKSRLLHRERPVTKYANTLDYKPFPPQIGQSMAQSTLPSSAQT